MTGTFYGRTDLLEEMLELWRNSKAKLMTCRGRRRIGKSTLVERFAELGKAVFWSFEGLPPHSKMTNQDQLDAFARRLAELANVPFRRFESWFDAFKELSERLPQDRRTVLLLDEISWMGKFDPNFPGELKFAWDKRWHSHAELVVVVCGSVSSWIDENILSNTGFVGRISLDVVVPELSIEEAASFWGKARSRIAPAEIMDVLSVTGGVPRYLEEVDPALSADENIKRMCFRPNGYLFRDFDDIFSTVFAANSVVKRRTLEALAEGAREATELASSLGVARNGQFTAMMKELELAGFVAIEHGFNPESGKRMRMVRYRLRDNYARFYLKYVKPHAPEISDGRYAFVSLENLPEWNSIMGLSFENLVLNNFRVLLKPLHLDGVQIFSAAPFRKAADAKGPGVQIDLLVQTRKSVTLVEVKRRAEIGESIEREVAEKVSKLKVPHTISVRTALIYAGRLSKAVRGNGYFDSIIDAASFIRGRG